MQLNHYNSKFNKNIFPIVLITDSVMRPFNVGSLIRTADAFGVKKIIFGSGPVKMNKQTWNASRATEKVVDFKQVENTLCEIKNYKQAGYRIIALEITDESIPIKNLKNNTNQHTVLIVGSERYGITKELLDISDEVYHIEMYGQNSSMNVVQATSIALYEITNKLKHA
jgi:tRNA G18 (ribose-2'-O)-methylase SpoU